jgi:hypothetical protein
VFKKKEKFFDVRFKPAAFVYVCDLCVVEHEYYSSFSCCQEGQFTQYYNSALGILFSPSNLSRVRLLNIADMLGLTL